jgi:hypothetical protein
MEGELGWAAPRGPRCAAKCPGTGRCTYYIVETVGDESRVIEGDRVLLIDHDSMTENLAS